MGSERRLGEVVLAVDALAGRTSVGGVKTGMMAGALALAAFRTAAAQAPAGGESARAQQIQARFQILAMEGVLERAVQLGAQRVRAQVQALAPDMLFITGAARAGSGSTATACSSTSMCPPCAAAWPGARRARTERSRPGADAHRAEAADRRRRRSRRPPRPAADAPAARSARRPRRHRRARRQACGASRVPLGELRLLLPSRRTRPRPCSRIPVTSIRRR